MSMELEIFLNRYKKPTCKNFFSSKDIKKEVKRQTTKWEKLFEINAFSMRLYPESVRNSNKFICNRKTIYWRT